MLPTASFLSGNGGGVKSPLLGVGTRADRGGGGRTQWNILLSNKVTGLCPASIYYLEVRTEKKKSGVISQS